MSRPVAVVVAAAVNTEIFRERASTTSTVFSIFIYLFGSLYH
jgi:hypothetical protein